MISRITPLLGYARHCINSETHMDDVNLADCGLEKLTGVSERF